MSPRARCAAGNDQLINEQGKADQPALKTVTQIELWRSPIA